MDLNDFIRSRYMAKEDVPHAPGVTLTIKSFDEQEMRDGDTKPCIIWTDDEYRPLLLNKTNIRRLQRICGTLETDELKGKRVNVYHDPDIEYGSEIVGGVRLGRVTNAKEPSDEIPF